MTDEYIRLCNGGNSRPWVLMLTPYWIAAHCSWADIPLWRPPLFELYPYQQKLVDEIRSKPYKRFYVLKGYR